MATKPAETTGEGKKQRAAMARGSFILAPEQAAQFNAAAEVFTGLNILKLQVGEVAGPFTLSKILKNQTLGSGRGKRAPKPVDVYVALHNGREIRMPVAASFVGKAKDSKLAVGDVFLVRRAEDYTSKEYGTRNCASYEIAITKRAGK